MRHFTFKELTESTTALVRGIDNMPKQIAVIDNMDNLIEQVLEPLRLAFGKPIIVTSGYRCEALNKAVGGTYNSFHLQGRAADIKALTRSDNKRLYELAKKIKTTELIAEQADINGVPLWIHIAF